MKTLYIYIAAAAILCALPAANDANAQTARGAYFMTSSHLRTFLNPALHPTNGYIGFPGAGNAFAEVRTNTLTLENFIFPYRENPSSPVKTMTFMHRDVQADKFLSNIADHNYVSASAGSDIFSLGFPAGRSYWTIHAGIRTRFSVDLPRGLFELLKRGFEDQENDEKLYDLSGLKASAVGYMEIGLGYSRALLGGRLILGVRPKLLLGAGDMQLEVDRLNVQGGTRKWELSSRATMRMSGVTPKYDAGAKNLDDFDFKLNSLPGRGWGVDFGGAFRLFDFGAAGKLTLFAAVNNIGTITWSASRNSVAQTQETTVSISPEKYSIHQGDYTSSIEDVLDDVADLMEAGIDFFDVPALSGKKRTSSLGMDANAGMEYALLRDKISVGLLYAAQTVEGNLAGECILSANFRPTSW
ncbi:MAG: DUF5723 family protein, partial [Odoribacteraceae bacterium]|nr:DUF5723 family protein [Odoribacteraceae bacterium]